MSDVTIEERTLAARPILFVRREVGWEEVATALGEIFGAVAGFLQSAGVAPAGPPFTRYPEAAGERLTIEAGMPVAAAVEGQGQIEAGQLQAGRAAVAVHAGHYETLRGTYQAIEAWMGERGLTPGGPPWESYLTDPQEHSDPADWRTEVCFPIA